MFAFADPTEWWVEIPPEIQIKSWQQCQSYPSSYRWNAYLNQLCLDVILPWLQTEYNLSVAAWQSPSPLFTLWAWINGTPIAIHRPSPPNNGANSSFTSPSTSSFTSPSTSPSALATKLIFLPTEAIDCSELAVPQEWVDIPNWNADYYLGVQVRLAQASNQASDQASWLRIWGYATHEQIKQSHYQAEEYTYYIDSQYLTKDLNSFSAILHYCPPVSCLQTSTQMAIAPVTQRSTVEVDHLIEGLIQAFNQRSSQHSTQPTLRFRRQAVPFSTWASLLESDEWRQRVYQQYFPTQAVPTQTPLSQPGQLPTEQLPTEQQHTQLLCLSRWLPQMLQDRLNRPVPQVSGWQSLQALFGNTAIQLAYGYRERLEEFDVVQAKSIELPGADSVETIGLLVGLNRQADERIAIRVQLHPLQQIYLPAHLQLALLSETGETLYQVQSRAQDNYIQLKRFKCSYGKRFHVRVTLESCSVTESFIV